MRIAPLAAAAALLLAAGAAEAHAHLVSSTPAKGAAGPSPAHIVLTFSEGLTPRFSGFEVAGPAGGAPVKVTTSGTTMTGAPAGPLPPGGYKVSWHAVSDDTHRTQGTFGFTVK